MVIYPEYMDTLTFIKLKQGEIPFYILDQSITFDVALHHHDFAEFSLVVKGNGYETINGRTYEMKAGTARFLLPYQIHSIQSDQDHPIHLFCCMFDLSVLFDSSIDSQLCQLLFQVGNKYPNSTFLQTEEKKRMQQLCEDMMNEYRSLEIGKDSSIRAKLMEALVLYIRSIHRTQAYDSTTSREQHVKKKDWEIISFINLNYINSITLKELSLQFGVSPSYVSRLFKTYFNISFLDYLHKLRLKRAISLLMTTEMAIYEVAEESGFESFRTFSRLFRQVYNKTPKEYRDDYHKK